LVYSFFGVVDSARGAGKTSDFFLSLGSRDFDDIAFAQDKGIVDEDESNANSEAGG